MANAVKTLRQHVGEAQYAFFPIEEGGQLLLALLPRQLPTLAVGGATPDADEATQALYEVRTVNAGCMQAPAPAPRALPGWPAPLSHPTQLAAAAHASTSSRQGVYARVSSGWRRHAEPRWRTFWRRCACFSPMAACRCCWRYTCRVSSRPPPSTGAAGGGACRWDARQP